MNQNYLVFYFGRPWWDWFHLCSFIFLKTSELEFFMHFASRKASKRRFQFFCFGSSTNVSFLLSFLIMSFENQYEVYEFQCLFNANGANIHAVKNNLHAICGYVSLSDETLLPVARNAAMDNFRLIKVAIPNFLNK